MATFSVGPDGRLLMDGKPITNLYGSVGSNVTDISTATQGAYDASSYDPRFYEPYQYFDGDAGPQTGYRLRPEVQQRLGDRIQLRDTGVGGYGEVNDPSQVEWDPEFGAITSRGNINAPDDGGLYNAMTNYVIPGVTIGAIGTGAAGMLGFGPLAESANGGLFGNAPSGASSGGFPTVDVPGDLSWTNIPAANPSMAAIPGGGGFLSSIGEYISSNPLSAARLGMAGANVVGGLLSGGRQPPGGGGGGGSPGGLLGSLGQGQPVNWAPNQYTMAQINRLYGG